MIMEDARVLGFPGWIAEMGGVLCTKQASQPEWHYFCGRMPYEEGCGKTPHDVIWETGVIERCSSAGPDISRRITTTASASSTARSRLP